MCKKSKKFAEEVTLKANWNCGEEKLMGSFWTSLPHSLSQDSLLVRDSTRGSERS